MKISLGRFVPIIKNGAIIGTFTGSDKIGGCSSSFSGEYRMSKAIILGREGVQCAES
ncbi:hypothetical protein [Treponema zioleckii]|uniref:hypothetical protein n=1 Tax=Treponema zioleckii TaxID=331680 RepID=UPI00168BF66D|nr:hypothetical protein [Treponema zioleckii]